MKKILIIVLLIMCIIASTTIPVLAKVKFGDWSKWDEEFPPYKIWKGYLNDGYSFSLGVMEAKNQEHLYWATNLFYKHKKELMSIILFVYDKPINPSEANYQFALVAFPPKNGNIVMRAYYKGEKDSLKFLEEWEIPYENDFLVVKTGKFLENFALWAERPTTKKIDLNDLNIRLITFDDKQFVILLKLKALIEVDIIKRIEESLK